MTMLLSCVPNLSRMMAALAVILAAAYMTAAQTRTFNYELYGCKARGTYDARKYTLRQLRDTVKLVDSVPSLPLQTNATPFTLAEIASIDVKKLETEYRRVLAETKALQMVPVQYFTKLKQRRIEGIERLFQLSRASMLAYETPASLDAVTWAPECSAKYAEPMKRGGESLLAAWLEVNMQSREKNGTPERLRREYEQQYASPDRMKYAQAEVMAFGWWNCANEHLDYADDGDKQQLEFEKLFKKVTTLYCYDV